MERSMTKNFPMTENSRESLSRGRLHGPSMGPSMLEVTSASYGRGGAGARVGYSFAKTSCGLILLGATANGVCWVGIHDSREYLAAELRRDFPQAAVSEDPTAGPWAEQVAALVEDGNSAIDLPIDIRATPFHLQGWQALCAIPRGATHTYGAIARELGRPDASRAVGHANGANPIAVVIPCHRVIGSDGALTGYRWGLEYKRRLLAREGARPADLNAGGDQIVLPIDLPAGFPLESRETASLEIGLRKS
jgi:AraC family transcriptional regulator of adaptative response/methylated-DNA-[protein]-cysteine methyltransferase